MSAWSTYYHMTTPRTRYSPTEPHGYAVVAIKRELERLGYKAPGFDVTTPLLGGAADKLIKAFQRSRGLRPDGVVGPMTSRLLFRDWVRHEQTRLGIQSDLLCKLISLESGYDPGATGYADPRDRGLAQINSHWHPDVTDAEAFDPHFAITWTAESLRTAYNYLHDWEAAVAAHNVGLETSRRWLEAGKPPGTAATYVRLVRGQSC